MPAKPLLTGDRELEQLLRKLPDKVQTQVVKSALRFVAKKPTKKYQAQLASHGLGFASAHIKAKFKTYRRQGNSVVIIGADKDAPEYKGQPVEKILNVDEYGWTKRGEGPGSRPPRPILRTIFAKLKSNNQIVSDFKKAIGRKIELAAKRLAKKR